MWTRTLIDSLSPRRSRPPARQARGGDSRRRPSACRLSIESLEARRVPASLAVSDATIIEGNAGTQYAEVVVRLDAPGNRTVTVNYGTANGTAVAGGDYQAASGKLSFAPGQTSKTVLVPVIGDRLGERDETFSVRLSGAKNAKIADGTGVATIVDDEPRLSIIGSYLPEGDSGTTLMTFTVRLSAEYHEAVTVDFATQDGTALSGQDYVATSGRLTFAPGETTKTITVEVIGDLLTEADDEAFYVNLGGASTNALIIGGQGRGSIIDDELPGWPSMPDPACEESPYPSC